jgi:hypothetical protein
MGGEGTHPAPLTIKPRYGEIPPGLSFFEDELGRRWAAKLLTKDEARRIAPAWEDLTMTPEDYFTNAVRMCSSLMAARQKARIA